MVIPAPTQRLRFREMSEADLDSMADLLGDRVQMRFYPRPKTRDEALDWIRWNQRNYADNGYGLWIVETHDGQFVGDCGLTWQSVGGDRLLEVGYHIASGHQGLGYATEAAKACVDLAFGDIGESHVAAIINPHNLASRRVVEKIGMRIEQEIENHRGLPIVVYGRRDTLL